MGYEPTPEFQQNAKDPLDELTDSSELWLIQWPINQAIDFDGKEVTTLKLNHDGHLGSFESSSGKSFDVVSFASQNPDAAVFSSSASKTKIVGKIAKRVSFVHYPEPDELQEQNPKDLKQMYERSATLSKSSNPFATPSQSSRSKHLHSGSGLASSSHGSGHRGTPLFASGRPLKTRKREYVDEPAKSEKHSGERKSKKTK